MKTINKIIVRANRLYIKCKLWMLSISLFQKKDKPAFSNGYIDTKLFYLNKFGKIPSIAEINNVNLKEILALIKTKRFGKPKKYYQYNCFEWGKKQARF